MATNDAKPKLFVVSLPRTATTSFCIAMLEQGFNVAHTAYTLESFKNADVIADTPIFNDFERLDGIFANAKFIYLERPVQAWLPSIRQLLVRMQTNLQRADGGFNPILKRCYTDIFGTYSLAELEDDNYLSHCYLKHRQRVVDYFAGRGQDLLMLQPDNQNWWQDTSNLLNLSLTPALFPHVNQGAKVTMWNDIRHTGKIESTRNGRVDDLSMLLYR